MKKVLVLVAIFIIFDRCMNYKISQARRYARIAHLKRQKELKKAFKIKQQQLAQSKKACKGASTQVS